MGPWLEILSHWGHHKIAVNLQTIFSNSLSCVKFWLQFHLNFSQCSNDKWVSIGSNNRLTSNRRQAIIWTDDSLVYWHIYASLGHDELMVSSIIANVLTDIYSYKETIKRVLPHHCQICPCGWPRQSSMNEMGCRMRIQRIPT